MLPVNKIINGDFNEISKVWPDQSFNAIITDPPYGVTKDKDDYTAIQFLEQAYRLLKNDSALMMFVGQATLREFWNEAERVGFKWLNTIVWYYKNTIKRERHRFAIQYDPILYFSKGNFKHNIDSVRVPYLSTERLKYKVNNSKKQGWAPNPLGAICGDVWEFPAITNAKNYGSDTPLGHKWQKPIALFDRMIKTTTKEGDIILDPFCGSGTSCLAARNNKVNYIGIDIDQKSYDIAIKRLSNQDSEEPQIKGQKLQLFE